jgi:hypothetical protein
MTPMRQHRMDTLVTTEWLGRPLDASNGGAFPCLLVLPNSF